MSKPVKPPEFLPGDIIASDLYMGVVTGAFWDATWCYEIGEAPSVSERTEDGKYPVGPKHIMRGDIKYFYRSHRTWSGL